MAAVNITPSAARFQRRLPFVLGVDLDGVVADFLGGLKPVAAEWLGVPADSLTDNVSYGLEEWGLNSYRDLHRFAVTQRQIFTALRPLPGAPAVLRRLSARGIHIRIITHRLFIEHFHAEAVQQTTAWLEHHGIPYRDLCFMKDKAAVGADLYLEDSPENICALREAGCEVIIMGNSTNRDVAGVRVNGWQDLEEQVLAAFERHQRTADGLAEQGGR